VRLTGMEGTGYLMEFTLKGKTRVRKRCVVVESAVEARRNGWAQVGVQS
jgi:hypothetical protein